ncbi:MAG: hypothetical protein QM778_37450 [Myxococcales bacterium]
MMLERHSWPDVDGLPVSVGDWIEVFCSWTHDPKFDGRAVQVVDILRGGRGVVFRLYDPQAADASHLYVLADGHGYRRVSFTAPRELN